MFFSLARAPFFLWLFFACTRLGSLDPFPTTPCVFASPRSFCKNSEFPVGSSHTRPVSHGSATSPRNLSWQSRPQAGRCLALRPCSYGDPSHIRNSIRFFKRSGSSNPTRPSVLLLTFFFHYLEERPCWTLMFRPLTARHAPSSRVYHRGLLPLRRVCGFFIAVPMALCAGVCDVPFSFPRPGA